MSKIMAEKIPQSNIYILQGNDDLAVQDYLKALAAQIKANDNADMDIEYFNGNTVDKTAIIQSINSLSLLSPKRLIVLEQAMDILGDKGSQEWLEGLLNQLPQSSVLVILIEDNQRYSKGQMVWQKVGGKHWLRKCVAECGRQTTWVEKALPGQRDMPRWIMREVERQGGKYDGRAAAELANLVGNNLFQARQEINKALSYVGPNEMVTYEIVRLLCSQSREEDIFALVDAVGTRKSGQALSLLARLLQDMPAQYIYSMLARQVRILLMAREVLDSGGSQNELASSARMHAFVAKKAIAQCRQFSMLELVDLYRQLDRMDENAKTGNVTLEVAMETLIADLSK